MTFIENDNRLEKIFEFNTYDDAIKFINKVANISETVNHHPDILLFDYKYVKISSTTHDAGNTITAKDTYITDLIDKI
ncbi:4a-hydroxytetrahydrobiopterin dehydratase [Candidatus Gracilibacteria bacterium]|nr:4a-hydroxytetrahydrobiopterin dehydratase [Candidatus Gracilibacteria bacterium]